MSFLAMASQRIKAAAAKKARHKAKAARLAAARQITTTTGEALTIPPRWTIKTLREKLREELHAAIRLRDGARCISCGKWPLAPNDWNAGHLFAVGPFPAVRFHPWNISSQCVMCNNYRGGNHASYALAFVGRYGIDTLTTLGELALKPRQWTAGEIYELLTVLRREGIAGYQARYFALTGWRVERAA